MFELKDRVALVTGASRGIGAETARHLAVQGASVVLAARSLDSLEEVAGEIREAGGKAWPLQLDLSEPEAIADVLKTLPEDFRDIDILVSNAGIVDDNLLARMSLDQWERVLKVNLTASYALSRALLRGMLKRRSGRVVLVSSVVGLMGNAGQTNYAASKAGLVGFAKSLAREVGSRGITVNVVAPGYVSTSMTEDLPDAARQQLEKEIVLGRLGEPADIASAVLYLVSDEADYVTGQVLNVSGGLYI